MKKNKSLILSGIFFAVFISLTILLKFIDVKSLGPQNSLIGFSNFNFQMHKLIGMHLFWHKITDVLGLVAISIAFFFGIFGFYQLIKTHSIKKIDKKLLSLGGIYFILIFVYVFFEKVIINFRPVILEKKLEASYPSSHIMLVTTILGTSIILLKNYLESKILYKIVSIVIYLIIAIAIIGRLISGIHWATDIIGGFFISLALISLYKGINNI